MLHKYFPSQFIWEVFWSCPNLETLTFHLKNPALQDSYRIFSRDCELVSQLPIPNKKARETKLPCSLIYLAHVSGIGLFIDYFYHNILRWK